MSSDKKKPTMSDVARVAGVNRVTASLALNDRRGSTRISTETRQRILKAAYELGYHPNASALALRRKQTGIIGLFLGYNLDLPDLFPLQIITGLQACLQDHGKDLLFYGHFRTRSEESLYAPLASGMIDGLVLIPSPGSALPERLAQSNLPVVAIADRASGIPAVVVQDEEGGRMQAQHLFERGYRRVLYRKDPFEHESSMRRLHAFRQMAWELDLQWIETVAGEGRTGLTAEEIAILSQPANTRPQAVVCWADSFTTGLIDYCHSAGLRIPHDLAIIGFDGLPSPFSQAYHLTTICAPWRQVAEKAAELLIKRIDGEEIPEETVFPVELVIGETT